MAWRNAGGSCGSHFRIKNRQIAEPLAQVQPWDVIRYKPPGVNDPEMPWGSEFGPGIVVDVRSNSSGFAPASMLVVPVTLYTGMREVQKEIELILQNRKQKRAMGLERPDDRLISPLESDVVPNRPAFIAAESVNGNGELRRVPEKLRQVITRLFSEAVANRWLNDRSFKYGDPEDLRILSTGRSGAVKFHCSAY